MTNDPRNPQAWFNLVAKDLAQAFKRFTEGDSEDCLFHLQQAAEKACKGKLIEMGWPLRKTHDLTELIEELKNRKQNCDWFQETASVLTSAYITDRYPGFADKPIEMDELQKFLKDAQRLVEKLTGEKPSNI